MSLTDNFEDDGNHITDEGTKPLSPNPTHVSVPPPPAKVDPVSDDSSVAAGTKSISDVAREVAQGKWGQGQDRRNRLRRAGYSVLKVEAAADRHFLPSS